MTRGDLSSRQARKIFDALHPTLGFLTQLERRLLELGFPPTDPYYGKVKAALDAYHRLAVETHYRACETGVGRTPRRDEERGGGER